MIVRVAPIVDYSVRELCKRPYYRHPRGCPNYGKRRTCPPQAAYYDKVYDLERPVYAVINKFDLKSHVERMRAGHPDWTDRQLRCVLYWQQKARKQLKKLIAHYETAFDNHFIETCPEAMGVDLIRTMKQVGIELIFPVEDVAYQIALIGEVFGRSDTNV